MAQLPEQLGLGTRGGCEAAVHATRRFITDMPPSHVIAKLDFSNAFNNVHRNAMLFAVADSVPKIYRFCHLAYDKTTHLKFDDSIILSQEGCQQGDPLGPTLFCLAVHQLLLACKSPLKIAYMDDITLGGPSADVAADVAMIKAEGPSRGLCLNESKCEAITTSGQSSIDLLQEFIQLTPSSATLLGAPLMVGQAMDECLSKRCDELERATTRLELITSHDALVLLRSSFSATKVQHTLRASPCFGHRSLLKFDQLLRDGLRKICNISLTEDQWLQASLPVRSGGLGIRRVSSLAVPAFLASAVSTRDLQDQILHNSAITPYLDLDICQLSWVAQHGQIPVQSASKQHAWDKPTIEAELSQLMERQKDNYDRARLLAAASEHSGDWLHALPISSCGLRLDDEAVRVAVGLR